MIPEPLPAIEPLVKVEGFQTIGYYHVVCRDCGDVTRTEGGSAETVPLQQAALYQQRHLARHLSALAAEIQEASR